MQIRTGIFSAVIFAVAMLDSQAGATEVQSTSYSTWLATASGVPTEWSMNVGSLEQVNGLDGSVYTLAGSQAERGKFSEPASNDAFDSAPATPSAGFASAVTIGGGLLFFGARRKVFSNISATRG